jgi:hypothetical protein
MEVYKQLFDPDKHATKYATFLGDTPAWNLMVGRLDKSKRESCYMAIFFS